MELTQIQENALSDGIDVTATIELSNGDEVRVDMKPISSPSAKKE